MSLAGQIVNLIAALLLLVSFAMLSQRRVRDLVDLFMIQGALLAAATLVTAVATGQSHLYYSAALTVALKVIVLPLILRRVLRRLALETDVELLINIPTTMLVGIALVVVAFNMAVPISQLAGTITRGALGIALA